MKQGGGRLDMQKERITFFWPCLLIKVKLQTSGTEHQQLRTPRWQLMGILFAVVPRDINMAINAKHFVRHGTFVFFRSHPKLPCKTSNAFLPPRCWRVPIVKRTTTLCKIQNYPKKKILHFFNDVLSKTKFQVSYHRINYSCVYDKK